MTAAAATALLGSVIPSKLKRFNGGLLNDDLAQLIMFLEGDERHRGTSLPGMAVFPAMLALNGAGPVSAC